MKFKNLIDYLDNQFPRSLSMPGDNDGVEVCVDYNLEIGRILIVLDITFDIIDYAVTHGYNCIISHHSLLYHPLKKLDLSTAASKKAVILARNNICAASFHTRLDSVGGGVNDCLINAVSVTDGERLKETEPLYFENIPIGRLVTLNREISLRTFVSDVKKSLKKYYKSAFMCDAMFNAAYIIGSGNVKKIGVVCGNGMSFGRIAAESGADTFFTGEGKYSDILDLHESFNLNIVTSGHFETEAVVLPFIQKKITEGFPEAKSDCFIC